MLTLWLAAGLLAFGVFILFVGIALRVTAAPSVDATLRYYSAEPLTLEELEKSRPFTSRVLIPFLRRLARLVNRFTPASSLDTLRHRLDVAGNPFNWTVVDFLGLQALGAILLGVLCILFVLSFRSAVVPSLALVAAGILLGYYLPMIWLLLKGRSRKDEIQRALPDALDLITISVEAGLGLDAAIQKVTHKWDNELSRALARVLAEIRVGKLRRDALRDMADRMDVPDVSTVVAAIIQADTLGVGITRVMRVQSDQMRVKRRQVAQEKAQQAPIKMLIPLAFFIFPAMFMVILGPSVIRLLTHGLIPK